MKKIAMTAAAMILTAAAASAQVITHEAGANAANEQHLQILTEKVASAGVHVSIETKPVTGAPYSAEATSETVQVLADGNRIVRRTTARVYRDGKGRTRRETLEPDGQVTSIMISDPVGGTSVVMDPGAKTVRHTGLATFVSEAGGHVEVFAPKVEVFTLKERSTGTAKHISIETNSGGKSISAHEAEQKAAQHAHQNAAQQPHVASVGSMSWVTSEHASAGAAPKKEDLGQQMIEGLQARGTRTTTEIPAGAIGNELPITVTAEEWVAVDLKVLVLTKHADPRTGETTYRLTGITRGEPDPSLFEPPAGVTVK